MAIMCEECKCTIYPNQGCDNGCECCNNPDYKSASDILSEIIAYLNIHKISLEQDLENHLQGTGYNELVSQISVLNHILEYVDELTNPLRKE